MRKCEDFDDPRYDEIFVNWYSPPIYNIYFDNIYIDNDTTSNDSNDNDILIKRWRFSLKRTQKVINKGKLLI